ncbi:hypothetical protein V8E51_013869 [Hyaloscypha variabilis]
MAQESDLEAGVHPRLPPPAHVQSDGEKSAQQELERSNHDQESPIPNLPVSSAREKLTSASQLRRRRTTDRRLLPTAEASGQAGNFFEVLQSQLEDGIRPYCMFLCWEVSINDQRAVPLLIEDKEDEVRVYRDMVQKLCEMQPWWLRHNPFYQVQDVKEVNFRFLREQENDFSVIIERLEISHIETDLVNELEGLNRYIAKITDPDEPEDWCCQSFKTGTWNHTNQQCISASRITLYDVEWDCPFEKQEQCTRKLDRLRLLSLPLMCFRDPEKAKDQRTLEGMAQNSCVYRSSEIGGYRGFKPRVAEAEFRGLMFRSGFQRRWVPFDALAIGILIATLWKVNGGSGVVAFAVGVCAFFLTLLSPILCKYFLTPGCPY